MYTYIYIYIYVYKLVIAPQRCAGGGARGEVRVALAASRRCFEALSVAVPRSTRGLYYNFTIISTTCVSRID